MNFGLFNPDYWADRGVRCAASRWVGQMNIYMLSLDTRNDALLILILCIRPLSHGLMQTLQPASDKTVDCVRYGTNSQEKRISVDLRSHYDCRQR